MRYRWIRTWRPFSWVAGKIIQVRWRGLPSPRGRGGPGNCRREGSPIDRANLAGTRGHVASHVEGAPVAPTLTDGSSPRGLTRIDSRQSAVRRTSTEQKGHPSVPGSLGSLRGGNGQVGAPGPGIDSWGEAGWQCTSVDDRVQVRTAGPRKQSSMFQHFDGRDCAGIPSGGRRPPRDWWTS